MGEIVALESLGVQAYRCIPNAEMLVGELGEAIRHGMLAIPDDSDAVARGQ